MPDLSKREHFAALVLASAMTNDVPTTFTFDQNVEVNWAIKMARRAVILADALIAELNKDDTNA